MYVCAIDSRPDSLRLVLTVQGEDRVPRLLEGQRLKRPVSAACLQATFQQWHEFYGVEVDLVVCGSSDALPLELQEALHTASGRVEWVERDRLDEVLTVWRETVPQARWLRGFMMALLASVPPPAPAHWRTPEVEDYLTRYHWLQAWFSSHLEEMELRTSVGEPADECDHGWLGEECPF